MMPLEVDPRLIAKWETMSGMPFDYVEAMRVYGSDKAINAMMLFAIALMRHTFKSGIVYHGRDHNVYILYADAPPTQYTVEMAVAA